MAIAGRPPLGRTGTGVALAALCAGVFVSGLDQTVVVTVLPQIVTDLHVGVNELDRAAWIVTAYLLGYTAAMPLLGRAADVYGHRLLFALCCALFAGGSWWAALTGNLWELVAARGLQAAGGGGMVPIALAAAAALTGDRMRVVALGAVAGAAEAGAVLGPLYGALMLEAFGWRSVFWVNLPLAALLVFAVATLLRARPMRMGRVDYVGAVLVGLSLLALSLGFSGENVVAPRYRVPLVALAALFALGFLLWSRRARWPLIALPLFRAAAFASANAANLLIGAALIVALVEVPLFALVILDRDATFGGLLLLRLTALIPVGAVVGGWLAARLPYSLVAAAGMGASAAGFARLSGWDAGIVEPVLSLDLALTGFGFGLVLAPLAGSVLGAARGGSEAIGAAVLTVARMLGMMGGLAALTTWGLGEFNRRVSRFPLPLREREQSEAVYQELLERYEANVEASALYVFDRLFLIAGVLCALAIIPACWLRPPDRHGGGHEEQTGPDDDRL